ncbi:MAG: glycerophosphodiester phosphodiesterase [Steroidobacteraceae bacterium]|nr:glycerophosphodiester phosphodiesterase [Steroidobacteraceae bacterium]
MADEPVVIAHRGASGYLPEHTLEAKALAHGLGADYLEQDVVLTRDGVPIVLHDLWLEELTDVATVYPGRARADGRWYAIDFTLEEIRRLRQHERRAPGGAALRWPGRFDAAGVGFRIHTLAEELAFIAGLNRSTGRHAGVYPEIKEPAWHHAEGKDITLAVLEVLAAAGYSRRGDDIYLQCFDPRELERIRFELKSELRLVQLIGDAGEVEGVAFAAMRTDEGLDRVAAYADGIGPHLSHLATLAPGAPPQSTGLVERAHRRGLRVHPYTFRVEQLAGWGLTAGQLNHWLFAVERADGLFTDQPDVTRAWLDRRPAAAPP